MRRYQSSEGKQAGVMNMARWGWLAALGVALIAGCATDRQVDMTSQIGRVEGIYVEQYNGVFVDRQLTGQLAGKPLWVYVTFDHALEDGSRFATAMLQEDLGLERGDLVQLRFGRSGGLGADKAPTPNRITALVAKHDTFEARSFGRAAGDTLVRRKAGTDL